MVLADLGADVVRIERPSGPSSEALDIERDLVLRHRRVALADLKDAASLSDVLAVVSCSDVLIEGLRPGVAERLGIGPDECLARNPGLVYGRITGWGQSGPMANDAGHDINYVGLTGALHAMGPSDQSPPPPLNLVGDFGGGSMLLLVGILSALFERSQSGRGQVVDAAMVDGVALLSQFTLSLRSAGTWSDRRHDNLLDGGAPFYDTYGCADGGFVAVGAIEPQFFDALIRGLGLDPTYAARRWDRASWPSLRAEMADAFAGRSRDEWVREFAGTDACVTAVLTFTEAAADPHLVARGTYVTVDGETQAAPAPRFSRTPSATVRPLDGRAVALSEVLEGWTRT
jgi:alpha-methylacyl-CoA racemase